jgi:LPXTG-motif cell wall-anchored protein
LKKWALVGAIVAMLTVATAPAIAQVSQGESERRITSGPSAPKAEVSNKGNNVSLCTDLLQAAQSGNVANEQGATQYNTKQGDIGFSGSSVELTPAATSECTQTIEQAAAAGPKAEAKAAPKAEAKAPEAKAEAKAEAKELPKTGGVAGTASLLGLGAGALLVAGGLLARRIIR